MNSKTDWLKKIAWNEQGLVPVIAQDALGEDVEEGAGLGRAADAGDGHAGRLAEQVDGGEAAVQAVFDLREHLICHLEVHE